MEPNSQSTIHTLAKQKQLDGMMRMISPNSIKDLNWWIHELESWNGRTLLTEVPEIIFESDASDSGWGFVTTKEAEIRNHQSASVGAWNQMESHKFGAINKKAIIRKSTRANYNSHFQHFFGLVRSERHQSTEGNSRTKTKLPR
ncbi:hypothetical protein BC937DRAFT_93019 [Endogone sp. FLAS-F59071]|nr:hypothetical protein BC937DRAFT_93019 [Endogone sp. FLAS-F59071]|eukprot:RUS21327.1 hypothetical protein BC937DRAFT_93019 [Endogone sp. FLAS-F59071]